MRWRRVVVRGPSMSPTLADGDVVLVTLGARPRPGAVLLVRWPARPGQLSVKRAVRAEAGAGPALWEVRGDNPFGSTDSRQLGPAAVLGVVRCRLWPRPGRLRPRAGEHGPRDQTGPEGQPDDQD
ncbi:MAG TPA: S26 family signal peptidase [Pseudonocardia sp.]|jgi:hypothetical protein|nr:S26 family signal peptidase [Pseudonocardia sp.]